MQRNKQIRRRAPRAAGAGAAPRYLPPPTTSLPALLHDGAGDQPFRAAVEAGWRSAQTLGAIMARLAAEVGISPRQYSILMVLAYADGGLSIGALAARLRVSQPFITSEVHKLYAAKIVVRRQNPADARSVMIALSEKGRAKTNRLAMLLREINDFLYQDMTRREFDLVRAFVTRLAERSGLALARMRPGAAAKSRGLPQEGEPRPPRRRRPSHA